MYTTTINGVKVNITKSNKEFKKLRAQFKNPDSGQMNTIHFGDNRYTHYKDKTGIWKHKDTNDPVRRSCAFLEPPEGRVERMREYNAV